MLDYIDKKYSMRKTFMCGAMKPVSLLFDQPTYFLKILPILSHIMTEPVSCCVFQPVQAPTSLLIYESSSGLGILNIEIILSKQQTMHIAIRLY